ncbi:MAG: Ig-like domain repeat protein [Terracidiphilus sp.]
MARRVQVPSWNWVLLCVVGLSLWLGAPSVWAATLHVDTLADTTHGSNDCGTGAGSSCSLRDAIGQANTDGSGDTIEFNSALDGGTITLTSALPAINVSVTITGPGANLLTVSGASTYQVFLVGTTSTPTVTISGLTVANGKSSGYGGAVEFQGGTLMVTNCTFSGNTASEGGGAIDVGGTLTVSGSTFTGNAGGSGGGAIFNRSTLVVTDSTFSGNSAPGASNGGGAIGILGAGTTTVTNNTFSGNSAIGSGASGGAIEVDSGAAMLTADNNIFSVNTATASGAAVYVLAGTINDTNNVWYGNTANGSEADCGGCQETITPATSNPLALPLGNYGGLTQTFLPLSGSAAICAGLFADVPVGLTTDQRGFALNAASCTNGGVDAGADQTNYIEVQNAGDGAGGACPGVGCTLRDAIAAAGSAGDIDFKSSVATVSLTPGNGALTLGAATGIEIVGPGASTLTVDGHGSSGAKLSVFTVSSGDQALLYGLTITGGYGYNGGNGGGGVYSQGALTILDSALINNVSAADGGGVVNYGGALTVADSTFSGNTSQVNGGGIANEGAGATASITESTIYNNSDGGGSATGGGIFNDEAMTVTGSTISGNNDTGSGGGGIYQGGTLTLSNSVVAGNNSPTSGDIDGAVAAGSYNLVGDGAGETGITNGASGNQVGTSASPLNALLSPLQLNGIGATLQTMIPLPGSPVICGGGASNIPSGVSTDERGYPLQPSGGYCSASTIDAGAVQTNYTSLAFVKQPVNVAVNTDMSAAPVVQLLETDKLLSSNNTDGVNGATLGLTLAAGGGTLSGNSTVTAGAGANAGEATYSSLKDDTAGMNDQLAASVTVVGTTTLSATSGEFNVIGPATQLVVTGPIAVTATAGDPFSVTVTAADSAGNTAAGYSGKVHFTTTDAGGGVVLPGDYTFVPGTDHGTHTFTNGVTLVTALSQTVTATDTVNPGISGTTAVIAVTANVPDVLFAAAGSSQFAYIHTGFATPLTAQVTDAYGNPESGLTVNFAAPGTGASAALSSSGTCTTGANGECSVTATANASTGGYHVSATVSGLTSVNFALTNSLPPNLVVTSAGDDAGTASNCTVQASTTTGTDASCGLRDALLKAANTGTANIYFDSTKFASATTITLTNGTLNIPSYTVITGPAAGVTVSGGGSGSNFTVITVAPSVTGVAIDSLTIANGYSVSGDGGIDNAGALTIAKCTISANVAEGTSWGGGIFNHGTLVVIDSTISGNVAQGASQGGGIYNNGTLTLTDSTVSGNSAGSGGGIYINGGTVAVSNSILSGNTATTDADCGGSGCPANGAAGNLVGGTVSLAALGNYGGPTQTMIPLPGSTAICAGLQGDIAAGVTTDQRGEPNTNTTYPGYSSTACVDAGAVQTNYSIAFTTNPPASLVVDQGLGLAVTVDESGVKATVATGEPIALTLTGGTLYGTASENTSSGVASYSGLTSTVGTSEKLTATLALNSSLAITAASSSFSETAASTKVALTSSAGADSSTGTGGSSIVNDSVTFTATVSAPAGGLVPLAGNVTFTDNGSPITVSSGCGASGVVAVTWNSGSSTATATCTTSALTGGNHSIVATYNKDSSDTNYLVSNNNVTEAVTAVATTVAAPMLVSPASPVVGDTVVVSATVAPTAGGTPAVSFSSTGTMTFFKGGTAISSCTAVTVTTSASGATASCSISGLTANTYSITAQYNAGDPSYSQSSASAALSLTVGKFALTITVTSSAPLPAGATVNQPVTFTATMAATQSLKGTVEFTDNSAPIAGCAAQTPTSIGVATCTDSGLVYSATPHVIQATYSGDSNYSTTIGTLTGGQTVNQASTTVTLSSSANPSGVTQDVTFTATVTPNPTGSTGLNGTVSFVDSVTSAAIPGCSNLTLTSTGGAGQMTCTTAALAVSPPAHTVTATYGSDANFSGNSNTFVQTVNPASSQISLTLSSPSPLLVNTLEVFTATIPLPSGITSLLGTISFTDNGSPIASCPPVSHPTGTSVTCTDNALTAGTHTIVAVYTGDSKFSVSNGTTTLTVNPGQSSTALTSNLNPSFTSNANSSSYQDSVTFTATVSAPAGAEVPLSSSGTVAFSGNGIPAVCSAVTPTAGVATCTTAALPDGANSIVATYSGDPNYATSTGAVTQTVEDYSVSVGPVPATAEGVLLTQGYSLSGDLFNPASLNVTPTSISGFAGSPTIACTASAAGAPTCSLAGSTLTVVPGSVQQSVGISLDAKTASPGTYTFTITATDPTTSIVRTTTFPATVRAVSTPLVIPSGATTGNTGTVTFTLPAGITLSNLSCPLVAGTGISSNAEKPSQIGMACTIDGTTIGNSGSTSTQSVTTTVTVTTNGAIASAVPPAIYPASKLLAAGLLGFPLFGLIGLICGRKSVKLSVFRLLAILAIGVAAFQTMGCGGSFKSTSTAVQGGTTPPGTYFLLVQGTGSDNNTYQAVLEVQVSLL